MTCCRCNRGGHHDWGLPDAAATAATTNTVVRPAAVSASTVATSIVQAQTNTDGGITEEERAKEARVSNLRQHTNEEERDDYGSATWRVSPIHAVCDSCT